MQDEPRTMGDDTLCTHVALFYLPAVRIAPRFNGVPEGAASKSADASSSPGKCGTCETLR